MLASPDRSLTLTLTHIQDENEVNLRKVAQRSGFVTRPLQVLRAGSEFDPVYAGTPIGLL